MFVSVVERVSGYVAHSTPEADRSQSSEPAVALKELVQLHPQSKVTSHPKSLSKQRWSIVS